MKKRVRVSFSRRQPQILLELLIFSICFLDFFAGGEICKLETNACAFHVIGGYLLTHDLILVNLTR